MYNCFILGCDIVNKTRTVWSLILVIFILLVAGVVYYLNKPSYALFSDEVTSKKTIELTVSSENTCNNNLRWICTPMHDS